MSYFNTYLSHINKYGNNMPDRIQAKREHDFNNFLNKSANKVTVKNEYNKAYDAVLQTKEYDENEVIDYLLTPVGCELDKGSFVITTGKHINKGYPQYWIIYNKDPYTSAGYNRYTILDCEDEMNWVYEGKKYSTIVHIASVGSGSTNKNITSHFKIQFSEAGVFLSKKRAAVVMQYSDGIKRNIRVTIGKTTWKVTGYDEISLPGLMYVTLEESLADENGDKPYANYDDLKNWTISCNYGPVIKVQRNGSIKNLYFVASYKEKDENVKMKMTCGLQKNQWKYTDNTFSTYNIPNETMETTITISLEDAPEVKQVFSIQFYSYKPSETIETTGPYKIRLMQQGEYKIYTSLQYSIFSESGKFTVASFEKDSSNKFYNLVINPVQMGSDKILIKNSRNVTISEYPIEIISPWLE